jgi:hypothetical protein
VRHHHAVRERHLQRQAAQIAARLGIEHLACLAERRARQPEAHGLKPSDRYQVMVAYDGVERQLGDPGDAGTGERPLAD